MKVISFTSCLTDRAAASTLDLVLPVPRGRTGLPEALICLPAGKICDANELLAETPFENFSELFGKIQEKALEGLVAASTCFYFSFSELTEHDPAKNCHSDLTEREYSLTEAALSPCFTNTRHLSPRTSRVDTTKYFSDRRVHLGENLLLFSFIGISSPE